MIQYEYFGPYGERRSASYSERDGALRIGERILCGFEVRQEAVRTPDGDPILVTFFQSVVGGSVWALYF